MNLNKIADVELLQKVIEELVIDVSIGIYPKAVVGGANPYKERNDYQNGWNDANMEYYKELVEILKKHDIQIKEM